MKNKVNNITSTISNNRQFAIKDVHHNQSTFVHTIIDYIQSMIIGRRIRTWTIDTGFAGRLLLVFDTHPNWHNDRCYEITTVEDLSDDQLYRSWHNSNISRVIVFDISSSLRADIAVEMVPMAMAEVTIQYQVGIGRYEVDEDLYKKATQIQFCRWTNQYGVTSTWLNRLIDAYVNNKVSTSTRIINAIRGVRPGSTFSMFHDLMAKKITDLYRQNYREYCRIRDRLGSSKMTETLQGLIDDHTVTYTSIDDFCEFIGVACYLGIDKLEPQKKSSEEKIHNTMTALDNNISKSGNGHAPVIPTVYDDDDMPEF